MNPSPYQLYALEFYIAHLKTSLDLINIRVEMRLFNAPYVVIKSKMDLSQSMWVLKSHYVMPGIQRDAPDLEAEPFSLDLRSMSQVIEEEEVEGEDEVPNSIEMEEAQKMAAYDPCADTKKDGPRKKEHRVTEEAAQLIKFNEPESQLAEEPAEETQDSVDLEDKRSQLRIFPEDPRGLPYNKVRKGKPKKIERRRSSNLKGYDLKTTNEERKSKGKLKEEVSKTSNDQLMNDKVTFGTGGGGDQEKYTVVESKLKNLPDIKPPLTRTSSIRDQRKRPDIPPEVLPSDIFESGVTIVLPMKPMEMLYNLQKTPLHVKVINEDNRFCAEASLDLWPLLECVLRAERGPPTPVVSTCEVTLHAHGDFDADIFTIIRLAAFGSHAVSKVKSQGENPNDAAVSFERPPERQPYTEIDRDIQAVPPMISSPDHLPRIPPRKYTQLEEETQLAKKEEDDYYAQNIAFCPIHRIVTPQPKDNYETMRWKIDKILGLTEVNIEEYELPDDEKGKGELPFEEEEEVDELELWNKNKKKELRSKWEKTKQTETKTRTILQKILMGMESPDPIRSKPDGLEKDVAFGEELEDEQPQEQLPEGELKAKKARFLFDEIRRQQQEERMIKHYKRVFRMMLRVLETERGVDVNEQRRRQKQRKRLQDLLAELETYQAEDVETAFIKVSREKMKSRKTRDWDVDTWPDVPEEEEVESKNLEELETSGNLNAEGPAQKLLQGRLNEDEEDGENAEEEQ